MKCYNCGAEMKFIEGMGPEAGSDPVQKCECGFWMNRAYLRQKEKEREKHEQTN